jgi:hypothetical protein
VKVVVAALLMSALISCTSDETRKDDSLDPGGRPRQGGSITFGVLGEPKTLNPYSQQASELTNAIADPLYPSLFTLDPDGTTSPELAERIDIDGRRATITLRQDARWTNGEPITSRDVVASWKRAGRGSGFEVVKDMRAVSGKTVVATGVAQNWEATLATDAPVLPVGHFDPRVTGGPFEVVDRRRGLSITLERSPSWWGGEAHLERVVIQHIDSVEIMLELLGSKRLDAAWVPSTVNLEQRLDRAGLLSTARYLGERIVFSGRVARALAGAVDEDVLDADLLRDDGEPFRRSATGVLPLGFSLAVPHGDELLSLLQRAIQIQLADRGVRMDQIETDVATFYGSWEESSPADARLLRSQGSAPGTVPLARVRSYIVWSRDIEGIGWGGSRPLSTLGNWWLP